MAGASLPDDVLHIICDQLGHQRDFSALFQCALTARRWSDPALVTLYRLYNVSPIVGGTDETEFNRQVARPNRGIDAANAEQELLVRKWAILWRSITLSSLEWTAPGSPTYREYCRYIRALNLRDLYQLLQDSKFYVCIKYFFHEPLHVFHFKSEIKPKKGKKGRTFQGIDLLSTISAIGEAITKKTLALEDISGPIKGNALPVPWIQRSPKLQSITVWDGGSLSNGAEEALRDNCPHFRSLSVYEWGTETADSQAAQFLNGLAPNTLQEFIIISHHNLGASAFQALNHHAASLTDLHLSNLREDSLTSLNHLKGCTSLRNLSLHDFDGSVSLENRHDDVFLEVLSWLTVCTSLKQISLQRFLDGPTMLTFILKNPNIHLEKLSITTYVAATPSARAFHSALGSSSSHNTALTSLSIKADGEDATPTDRADLVDWLGALTSLRELELKDISDFFTDEHITSLALSLPHLEYLWVSGEGITDAVLAPLASLRNLRSLMLYALTRFTADALLDFVDALELPGNRGFQLSVVNAELESQVNPEEIVLIKDRIAERVEGTFDFNSWRDDEDESFEGESD